jgi:hypothetical protein
MKVSYNRPLLPPFILYLFNQYKYIMTDKYFNECANANDLRTRYEEIVRMFNLQALPDGGFKTEVEQEFQAKLTSFTSASQNPADEDQSSNPNPLPIETIRKRYGAKQIGMGI